MARALELAGAAQEWGDTPIGAVVLAPDGAVLAEAANEREKRGDPTAHAEVLALRAAAQAHGDGWRLSGCTLVVTLEPCTMCAGASVLARVGRVVYGADDPKAAVACPSGRRSTPRKRVRATPSVGSNPTATAV